MEIRYLPNKNLIMLIPLNSDGCSAPRERIQSVLGTDKVVEIDTCLLYTSPSPRD